MRTRLDYAGPLANLELLELKVVHHFYYPIYVLPYGLGYVSVVDKSHESDPPHQLVVCGELHHAQQLMQQYDLPGEPRPLENDREFAWLLESLREPVTQVSFDPQLSDDTADSAWQVSVHDLLKSHLEPDLSPWNYPVFVMAVGEGFAGVHGASEAEESFMAIGVFSTESKAKQFTSHGPQPANVCQIDDIDTAVRFFEGIQDTIDAVAIDPEADGEMHLAKHCLAIDILLTKYLVPASRLESSHGHDESSASEA